MSLQVGRFQSAGLAGKASVSSTAGVVTDIVLRPRVFQPRFPGAIDCDVLAGPA